MSSGKRLEKETMEQYHERLRQQKKAEKKKLAGSPMAMSFRQDQHQIPRHFRRNRRFMADLAERVVSKNLTTVNPSAEDEAKAE